MSSIRSIADIPDLDRFFVGGEWVSSVGALRTPLLSPATEEFLADIPLAMREHVDDAVRAARNVIDNTDWPSLTPVERSAYVVRISQQLSKRADLLARLFMMESGRPYPAARGAIDMSITILESAAATAVELMVEEHRSVDSNRRAIVRREPIGVVAAITPWNGPLLLGSAKLAPALIAGCAVVMRPAPEVPLTTWVLGEAIKAAELPPGVVSILPAETEVTKYLVAHPDVDMVSFTGSTQVGREIMKTCAGSLKRLSLELGGKSAAILLDDADIETTIPSLIAASGLRAAGQVCTARTRILVSRARHDEWVAALCSAVKKEVLGDQLDPATTLEPLATEAQRTRVENYIKTGIAEGASLIAGGRRPAAKSRGWYVEPTLFDNVTSSMTIAQEEIFGPVLSIMTYEDIDDAITIANDSIYGLAGTVYCADDAQGYAIAKRVRAGTFQVNTAGPAILQPFGGYKQSGIGREGGIEGILEFTQIKQIQFPKRAAARDWTGV